MTGDILFQYQTQLFERQLRGQIISSILGGIAMGLAYNIGSKQVKLSKSQFLLAKYQTTANMIMIIQGNIQKAISKGDIETELKQENLIPEAMGILDSVGRELEEMKL